MGDTRLMDPSSPDGKSPVTATDPIRRGGVATRDVQQSVQQVLRTAPEIRTPDELLTEFSDLLRAEQISPSKVHMPPTERNRPRNRLRRLAIGCGIAVTVLVLAGGLGAVLSKLLLEQTVTAQATAGPTPQVSATTNGINVDPTAGKAAQPQADAAGVPSIDRDSVGFEVVSLIDNTTSLPPAEMDPYLCLDSLNRDSTSLLTMESVVWNQDGVTAPAWLLVTTVNQSEQSIQDIRNTQASLVVAVAAPANCGTSSAPERVNAIWQGVIVYNHDSE